MLSVSEIGSLVDGMQKVKGRNWKRKRKSTIEKDQHYRPYGREDEMDA